MKKRIAIVLCLFISVFALAQKIDRKNLVQRHNIVLHAVDTLSSLSVGNGKFAFTVDITGLQSFPDAYAKGVPLGTESEWGWHSFPNKDAQQFTDALKTYMLNGRPVQYAVQWGSSGPEKNRKAADYFRQNLHRLQLGNIGFDITKKDGSPASINDIKDIFQELDMWTGEIKTKFKVEGEQVEVHTFCHGEKDAIGVDVVSDLITKGRLKVRFRFPYPTGGWADMGNNFSSDEKHMTRLVSDGETAATIIHTLDTTQYFAKIKWNGNASLKERSAHYFVLQANAGNELSFTCEFTPKQDPLFAPTFSQAKNSSEKAWLKFWQSGGAIDFAGSTDKRAAELERRVILSQYLTRIQCAGSNPPQETGLTYNSWYGKPHIEMHWWHAVHFALWGRPELLEKSMSWYLKVADTAKKIAQRQGYEGVRWQKMTDNDGREVPSSIGAFLIWQQPHFIYFAELLYRDAHQKRILNKYSKLVFATADFMASYARYDSVLKRYVLGKGVIAAQERFKAEETFNPTYELCYWYWALNTAQQWRVRLGLARNKKWDDVMTRLSPLPVQGNKYLFTESATDSYSNPEFRTDHPSVFGALGMLPATPLVDTAKMRNTFDWIWNNWTWKQTWGWDFPMTAMTATRLGLNEKAVDALLMPIQTNTYLPNGHNYQDDRLTIYLPGNGGVLSAIAMMCAGYDGSKDQPGIPKNSGWHVKWEGLKKMP